MINDILFAMDLVSLAETDPIDGLTVDMMDAGDNMYELRRQRRRGLNEWYKEHQPEFVMPEIPERIVEIPTEEPQVPPKIDTNIQNETISVNVGEYLTLMDNLSNAIKLLEEAQKRMISAVEGGCTP